MTIEQLIECRDLLTEQLKTAKNTTHILKLKGWIDSVDSKIVEYKAKERKAV